jgi:hypothetical protein
MSKLTDNDAAAYAVVDEALRSYPLAPVPARLLPLVMARIQALEPKPQFRLNWLDYAVSLFIAGMAGLVVLLRWSIPAQVVVHTQVQFRLLQQYFNATDLWLILLGGLVLFTLILFSAALLFERGRASFVER